MTTQPPAPRPCASCPYRSDVPSGVWSEEEYGKLPLYDGPTWTQPPQLFLCHQHDRDSDRARVCGGWAGCHDGDGLLALRVAASRGAITVKTADAVRDYASPVPLFESGAEAAAHGMRDIHNPGPAARRAIEKISRTRTDIDPLTPAPTLDQPQQGSSMTTRRPSKPWKVILTGPDITAESQHTSEAKTYMFVRTALGPDGPATKARVEHWEDGRWIWFDTMTAEEINR